MAESAQETGRLPEIVFARGETPLALRLRMASRHGLVAGATGTGKTVSLQVLAEGFSALGVPVFLADVKGDLAGLSQPGEAGGKLEARAREVGVPRVPRAAPVTFWDPFGELGHPLRTTVSELGPLLLARLLDLNEVQSGVLHVAFRLADDEGLLLLDLADLRAVLAHVGEHAKEVSLRYGHVTAASIGAIQRALLRLEDEGGARLFGEPAFGLDELLRLAPDGRGTVNVLAAESLFRRPRAYATLLLWLLAELFEELPEVGDLEKPRLVFFFDEAHLLFDDAPEALVEQVEQVVRLVRSKGVGVFFVTQNPLDLPDRVLGQLGNRVQHALRAFTPRDQRVVRAVAETFRPNPPLDPEAAVTELAVGEALVSFLDAKGTPAPVQRAKVRPPDSRLGAITPAERAAVRGASPVGTRYDVPVDRESAAERLRARAEAAATGPAEAPGRGRPRQGAFEAFAKSMVRSLGSQLGRRLARGVLGALSRR